MAIDLSVIVPVYNEEQVIGACHERLTAVLSRLPESYEIVFVDDGSRDGTSAIARSLRSRDKRVQLVEFSRNFGHQAAISAGMAYARGRAVVVIDADLQDPPEAIPEMVAKWKEGYEVVYGKRVSRRGETWFKRASSKLFYRFLSRMTEVSIPVDVGDFRLIDRKVCDALNGLGEKHRYVRGLISWLGFRQAEVRFERAPRYAGKTKYPLRRMLSLALDGIVSFSYKPLRLAVFPGLAMALAGFAYLVYIVYRKLAVGDTELGWASIMCAILLLNGYTLIVLGIMGEYLGRLFEEAKGRPLYVVREALFQDPAE